MKKSVSKESPLQDENFAEQYIQLRKKEGRLYNDDELRQLPNIRKDHPHYKEWQIRKRSCRKLLHYIRKKNNILNILEIGCGNGWLTAQLLKVTSGNVTGLDINGIEIEQARKVFGEIANCNFIEGNISRCVLGEQRFDLIVFAASIQYFQSFKDIIFTALDLLTLQGEIHIIDSKLYQYNQVAEAQERSKTYFTSMGFPEMADHYFHHPINNLQGFNAKILHDPASWWNKLSYPANPFHWIVIKNGFC